MKYIITLICFWSITFTNAQVPKILSNNSQLTQVELNKAKEDYLRMMKTKTYLEYKKNISLFIEKSNRLVLPKGLFNFDKFITDHLAETNFKTVEEALFLKNTSVDLLSKLMKENPELYDSMGSCSTEQLGEIMKPEREIHEMRKLLSRPK